LKIKTPDFLIVSAGNQHLFLKKLKKLKKSFKK
jgi:hypothetical protein